jgi:hypothetical protein
MKKLFVYFFLVLLTIGFHSETKKLPDPNITAEDLRAHISYLASDELKGRFTGTEECKLAADYIKNEFMSYSLIPAWENSYYQEFPFIANIEVTENNSLSILSGGEEIHLSLYKDFITAPFSGSSNVSSELVFAGYGISASKLNYDDYSDVDVTGKIVVVMSYHPEYDNPHSQFDEYSSFRQKAATARDKGAAGIILVNGHYPEIEEDKLMDFRYDRAASIKNFGAVHVKRKFIDELFRKQNLTFSEYQAQMTTEKSPAPFNFNELKIKLITEVKEVEKISWNVAGIIEGNDPLLKDEFIVIGAHFDHLGMGEVGSLYRGNEPQIHNGADDNASGTAGVLELAEKFSSMSESLKRSIIFVSFSGEELGLLGSGYFVNNSPVPLNKIVTMINMDMIGRMNDDNQLIVYGTATSSSWKEMIDSKNNYGFKLALNDEGYGPSDHSSFYGKEIPVLFFFTGTHTDYHRPSDDYDKINYAGQEKIVNFIFDITQEINFMQRPDYVHVPRKEGRDMGGWKVYVGTIPDYASTSEGFKISGVNEESPAQKSGLKGGDVIISFGGKAITNIYDYVYALREFSPGDIVEIVIKRDDEELKFQIELGAR